MDCTTGATIALPCVRRSETGSKPSKKDSEVSKTQPGDPDAKAATQACQDAVNAAKAACAWPGDTPVPICDEAHSGSTVALPYCEDIEALEETHPCSGLLKDRWDSQGGNPLERLGDNPLASPPEGHFQSPPAPQPGSGTPPPTPAGKLPVKNWSTPLPTLRIEIPGSFLRFFLANAALPSALERLGQRAKDAMIGGITCDKAALTCTINPLHVLAPQWLQEKVLKKGVMADITQSDNGLRISNLSYGTDAIRATLSGTIDLEPTSPIRIDLMHATNLQIVPLHDPKNANGYSTKLSALDQRSSYLDRAWVVSGLKGSECQDLLHKQVKWSKGVPALVDSGGTSLSGAYFTYIQPFKCLCNGPQSDNPSTDNFCVVDPWPRPVMIDQFGASALQNSQWQVHEAFCNAGIGTAGNPAGDQVDAGNTTAFTPSETLFSVEDSLADFYQKGGMSPASLQQLGSVFEELGCSGRRMTRLAIGPQLGLGFQLAAQQANVLFGKRVTSATGFKLSTRVQMGGIKATLEPSATLRIKLLFFAQLEEWVQEKVGIFGFLVKWILRLVRLVFEDTLSAIASLTLELLKTAGNTASVDFGSLDLEVHGLLSHVSAPDGSSALEIGVRRVTSSVPAISQVNFGLKWNTPACAELSASSSIGNKIKNALKCVMETIQALIDHAAYPVTHFVAEDCLGLMTKLGEITSAKLTDTALGAATTLEHKSNIAGLIASAMRSVLLRPYYLVGPATTPQAAMAIKPGDESSETQQIQKKLPPPFNQVCMLSSQPTFSCLVANLFAGQRRLPGATIVRMGAMTHYRSFWEGDQKSIATDWNFPTVRYCIGGDVPPTPPNLTDYSFDEPQGLLHRLTDFDEIDRTASQQDRTTDWRTQCAAFMDLHVRTHSRIPAQTFTLPAPPQADLIAVPSVRSNFLLNEVFFCPDNGHCDPTAPVPAADATAAAKNANLRYRALLATCSLLGDLWYAPCPTDAAGNHCDQVTLYHNALADADKSQQLLSQFLQDECKGDAACQAQTDAAQALGKGVKACVKMLAEQGYDFPPSLKSSAIPAELK
jgi:hypothetical protein